MKTIIDIHRAVVMMLEGNGLMVYPWNQQDGFEKPAAFVNVFPSKFHLENKFTETVTASVVIEVVSKTETWEEQVATSQRLKDLFFGKTINIDGRHPTIYDLEFEPEKSSLFCTFSIEFTQKTDYDPNVGYSDVMENLGIGGY